MPDNSYKILCLYAWNTAKFLCGLRITMRDESGFWEAHGYLNSGDPWRQQRCGGRG
jgi:DMSO/TMAO reductase YedYZ molybdopterin-dependent catalytic subunit